MGELKSCPFCGCDPIPDYCSTNDGPAYLFHCQSKDCPAWPSAQGDTEAEAIAAWNTRSTPDPNAVLAGVAWLRDLAGTCKGTASNLYRDDESDEAAEEWRVRGESYAFIADQIERGHSPFTEQAALTTTPEPTDPAGVSGVVERFAMQIDAMVLVYSNNHAAGIEAGHKAKEFAAEFLAALRPSPVLEVAKEALGEAFSTLTYVFECSGDEQASRAAKEAADKIESALATIKEGEAP